MVEGFLRIPGCKCSNGIAKSHFTFLDDDRRDAAMTAHRVIAAATQYFLHARTRRTYLDTFQHRPADAKSPPAQGGEADARDGDIAAQFGRIDTLQAGKGGDRRKMLGLDQRDGARARLVAMIAYKSALADESAFEPCDRRASFRPNPDEGNPAFPREAGDEVGNDFHGCVPVSGGFAQKLDDNPAMRDSTIRYCTLQSPIGPLLLAGSDESLKVLSFPQGRGARRPKSEWHEDPSAFRETARQLHAYFAGERTGFDLPLAPEGNPFQRKVWEALLQIPYGATATYGEIATAIGEPLSASRAVGAANGANPLPIVIPCHRVIGAGGALTGFGGGIETKKFLLDLEFRVRPPKDTLFALM